jgi:hypothetical protein
MVLRPPNDIATVRPRLHNVGIWAAIRVQPAVCCASYARASFDLTEEMTMETPGIRVRTYEWIPLDDVEHAEVVRR